MNAKSNQVEGQCYTNPTYGESSMTQAMMPSTYIATYDAVGLPNQETAVNGSQQKYNVLNREQQQGSWYQKYS